MMFVFGLEGFSIIYYLFVFFYYHRKKNNFYPKFKKCNLLPTDNFKQAGKQKRKLGCFLEI